MVKIEAESKGNNSRKERQYLSFERVWVKYKYRSMHPERKARGIDIIIVLAPGQDRSRDGTAVFALFEETIHT